jgi:hypothetical protein
MTHNSVGHSNGAQNDRFEGSPLSGVIPSSQHVLRGLEIAALILFAIPAAAILRRPPLAADAALRAAD